MSESLWNELEEFWDKENVEEKAEKYQELYEDPKEDSQNVEEFSWVHEKDNLNAKSQSIAWGIPNHVLGDIDKAKVVVGLLNPGTLITDEEAKEYTTIRGYIKEELERENSNNQSNEVYLGDSNNKDQLYEFYRNHILSKENVLSIELKRFYELYKENPSNLNCLYKNKGEAFSSIAYYLKNYYCHSLSEKGTKYRIAIEHYRSIFEKMCEVKNVKNDIEKDFEEALSNMSIANIELVPYRSNKSKAIGNIDGLESSKLSAKILIKKILRDLDTIVILRSLEGWEGLFKIVCEEKGFNFERDIAPNIYEFKNQNGAISKDNIVPYLSEENESSKSIDEVIDELGDIISLKDFETELNKLLKEKNEKEQ